MPEQDAVLAITGAVKDMQTPLDLVWTHLLPAMSRYPLAADEEADAALRQKLAGLKLSPPKGQPNPALAAQITGDAYVFAPNRAGIEAVRLDFEGPIARVMMRDRPRRSRGGLRRGALALWGVLLPRADR